MLVFVLSAMIAAASPAETAFKACLNTRANNYERGECSDRYVRQADAALNAKWKQLMAATSGKTQADLITEERAWIAFKQTACQFYMDGDWGRNGEVADGPGCVGAVLEQRTRALSAYLSYVKP